MKHQYGLLSLIENENYSEYMQEKLIIDDNCVVTMHYKLANGLGELIDSSQGELPLVYMQNTGALLPSLERELTGKQRGDVFEIIIYPEDGYGYSQEELIQDIPRSAFANFEDIKIGMRVKVKNKSSEAQLVSVLEIGSDTVVVDANHALAGQVLHFEIAIVDVREPSPEELSQGYAVTSGSAASK